MRGNNVVGVLFSNVHDDKIRELTERRTIASVPFGGRYRLIDFPLSNMVNSGISKVGVGINPMLFPNRSSRFGKSMGFIP